MSLVLCQKTCREHMQRVSYIDRQYNIAVTYEDLISIDGEEINFRTKLSIHFIAFSDKIQLSKLILYIINFVTDIPSFKNNLIRTNYIVTFFFKLIKYYYIFLFAI